MAKVEGSETLALPPQRVWDLLNDPEVLGTSIPGCRGFERDGDAEHRYLTAITVAIGAVKGVYEGTVSYADIEAPERCTIEVSGRGDKGTIDGRGAIELKPADAGTEVVYRGDFKLTGPVAGIGQRLAPGISRKMIVETLRNLEQQGGATPGAEAAAASSASDQSARPVANQTAHGRAATASGSVSAANRGRSVPGRDAIPPTEAARAPRPASPEPFNPIALPVWVRVAVPLIAGLVLGVILGRIS